MAAREPRSVRRSAVLRLAMVADVLGLAVAGLVAVAVSGVGRTDAIILLALFLLLWTLGARAFRTRGPDEGPLRQSVFGEARPVVELTLAVSWVLVVVGWLMQLGRPGLTMMIVLVPLAVALVLVGRSLLRYFLRRNGALRQRVLVLGAGSVGQLMATKMRTTPGDGLDVVGFVDADPLALDPVLRDLPVWRRPDDLNRLVEELDVDRVVVAYSRLSHQDTLRLLDLVRDKDVSVDVVPRFYEFLGPKATLETFEGMAVMRWPIATFSSRSLALKRMEDVVLSAVGLILIAPLILLTALFVKLDSPGPIFFRHERIGRSGKPFRIIKFRTFRNEFCTGSQYGGKDAERMFADLITRDDNAEEFQKTFKLKNDPRVTRIGRLLRSTSLDELPQLFNVLRGDISLVGPRPVTQTELERYGERAPTLLSIMPGITGYWQTNGRSEVDYAERVRLDMAYVANWSLGLDFMILLKTFRTLVNNQAY
jgi:undecaprenyl-phosphate galactose phosphotransferase